MIVNFVFKVFPIVSRELDYWSAKAEQIPDWELRTQALSSLRSKKFHAQGGSVYALHQGTELAPTIRFIVALQTISDYLDNLSDRAGVIDEQAFFQLHLAMAEAVDPDRPISDYYRYYPAKNDQGYLEKLVLTCRQQLKKQPSYHLVLPKITAYVQRYSELQSYKHLAVETRENRLRDWAQQNLNPATAIYWWEYAAATGSTLGMFLLFAVSSNPALTAKVVAAIDAAYFPWLTGLHILLDYFIDAAEDEKMGDYNFTIKYETSSECLERLAFFIQQSIQACRYLPQRRFHLTVIRGLLAMYLSDPKALTPELKNNSLYLVRQGGLESRLYHGVCGLLRFFNKL